MTIQATDPNAAFTAERQAQIASIREFNTTRVERHEQRNADADARYAADLARFEARVASGELRPLGEGRFESTQGWDAGEVWTVRRINVGGVEQELAMPEHGLDTTTGTAALYSRHPAWHGLGNIRLEGVSDIQSVLELSGLDWEAVSRPVTYDWNGEIMTVPGKFINVRSDNGGPLGIIGKTYNKGGIIQNRQAFEFLQDLVEEYNIIWETAGALNGGTKVFVCLRLPESVRIDVEGINDEIRPYITALNSHDGGSQFQVIATPWRVECGNTERFALRDAYTRWSTRHTSGATSKMAEARRTLGLTLKYYEAFAAEEEKLARQSLEIDELIGLFDELFVPEETEKSEKNRASRLEVVEGLWARNTAKLGRTAYAGERVVTEFLDHHAEVRPGKTLTAELARAAKALTGGNDEKKATAHKRLLMLTNR